MRRILAAVFSFCAIASYAQPPELLLQKGHSAPVHVIRFAPNGTYFATGADDKLVKLTDVSTGFCFHTFIAHTEPVINILFTPDGKKLITGSKEELIVWDLQTEKRLYFFDEGLDLPGTVIAVSPDSKELIFQSSKDNTFVTVDLTTGHSNTDRDFSLGDIEHLAYSADGKNFLVITNSAVHVYDRGTNEERFSLGTQRSPKCFYITRDSKYYYCANDHVNWQKWELPTGKLVDTRQGREDNSEMIGDEHLVTVNDDHTIMAVQDYENYSFYDLWTGRLLQKIVFSDKEKEARITFTAAAFSPQGNVLVTSSVNLNDDESDHRPHVRFIDTRSGRTIMETAGYSGSVSSIFLAPDDKSIAITGDHQPLRIWTMDKTGGRMISLNSQTDETERVYWSPDSRVVVSGGMGKDYMTDLNTGDHKGVKDHFTFMMSGNDMGDNFCISPDFKLVCGQNQVMNYENGNSVCVASYRDDYYHKGSDPEASSKGYLVDQKTFLKDNRTLVLVGSDGRQVNVNILDIVDCKKKGVISYNCGTVMDEENELKYAVSPGDKYIALGVNTVRVYNISTQDMVMEIPFHGPDKEDVFVSAVAINSQENLLAVSYLDTTVVIYEIPSGKKLQTIRGHDLPATSLVFRGKNNMLITAAPDSKIIFWDPTTGEQLGTMAAVDSTDFIITTPDNYYFATRGALKKVAFRKGRKTFPFEQFDLKFNRPDIVFRKLDLASNAQIKMYYLAYQKRLQKAGFTEAMLGDDLYLPEVEVVNKYNLPILKYDDTLSFVISAKDEKYTLNRINIYVNDVSVYGSKGFSLADKPRNKLQRVTLKLSQGINRIQVSVTNDKGMESMRDEFEVSCQLTDRKPDLYLLVIGVSQFKDAQHNLKYAAKDAQDLVSAFTNDPQFGHVIVKQVLNTDATKENILKEGNMFADAKVDDVVMLYVSSHGLLDEKLDYYIATTDVTFSDPSGRGLPYQELENMMERSPSRNRLVLIDACHSGEVDKDETDIVQNKTVSDNKNVQVVSKSGGFDVAPRTGLNNSFAYMQALFDDVSKGIGVTIISAAGGTEYAYESKDWNNGVFTYSILNGIKSKDADANKDGVITVNELKEYVRGEVIKLTEGKQVPNARKENLTNDFILH